MPFKSESQRRFMYSQHPELAKEFEKVTPKGADLPEHVKKMADGGVTAGNPATEDSGLQDASVSDFLLPYLLGPSAMKAGAELPAISEGLGEAGEIGLGKASTEGGDLASKLYRVSKGTMGEGPNKVTIWGVKGAPEDVAKLGYGTDPASIPEHILNAHNIPELPESQNPTAPFAQDLRQLWGDVAKQQSGTPITARAPYEHPEGFMAEGGYTPTPEAVNKMPSNTTSTPFAEGGKVERSSLEHQVPNAMMARAMNKGGAPGVTFLQNVPLDEVKKATHVEGLPASVEKTDTMTGEKNGFQKKMAKGGVVEHAPGGDVHVNRESHVSVPIVSKDTEFHLKRSPAELAKDNVGDTVKVALPATVTSKEGDMERVKTHGDAEVQKSGELPMPITMSKGGKPAMPGDPKLHAIYKAMGIKKYADGGDVQGDVDASQLPNPTPNPNDPGFWDSIKSALAQVGRPFMAPGLAASSANATETPGIAPAVNAALGTNLTGPAAGPAPVAPVNLPPASPVLPTAAPTTATNKPIAPSQAPNLNNLFNQDTSKLTAGVNPEDRQALANQLQSQQHGIGAIIAQAVAGLGDALAAKGGREQHSLQNIFAMEKTQRDEALANFDKVRQDRLQKVALQTQLGQNAIQQLAAKDAYGTDENLNRMLGAPAGTAHKDLPLYFQAKSAEVAKQEKLADLYMKATAEADTQVDNNIKNMSVLGIKPSATELQAMKENARDKMYSSAQGLYHTATNPQTGHRIETYDGGATWRPAGSH